jgi:hypothetical protein
MVSEAAYGSDSALRIQIDDGNLSYHLVSLLQGSDLHDSTPSGGTLLPVSLPIGKIQMQAESTNVH